MTLAARILGAVLALAATAALVVLSGVYVEAEASDDALLRLSWRAVGERIEACRAPTTAELDALPPHMRPSEICEGRLAPFRLVVHLDGEVVVEREIRAAGAREDRPTYVFEEVAVEPGQRRLEVLFATVADEAAAEAPPLHLVTDLVAESRRVALVTLDERGALSLVTEAR